MIAPRIAVAFFLAGALVCLAGFSWASIATDARVGVGVAMLAAILLLLGVHRRAVE